jgi:hypothetical protein
VDGYVLTRSDCVRRERRLLAKGFGIRRVIGPGGRSGEEPDGVDGEEREDEGEEMMWVRINRASEDGANLELDEMGVETIWRARDEDLIVVDVMMNWSRWRDEIDCRGRLILVEEVDNSQMIMRTHKR